MSSAAETGRILSLQITNLANKPLGCYHHSMKKSNSTISTKTGDDGTTGLGDDTRVNKDHIRIEALGAIDELDANLGLLRAQDDIPNEISKTLFRIQEELIDVGAELSKSVSEKITDKMVSSLEDNVNQIEKKLQPLKNFIIPGGSKAAAQCHVARTVCRRAERCIVKLSRQEKINPITIQYLNRLSDLLFLIARTFSA